MANPEPMELDKETAAEIAKIKSEFEKQEKKITAGQKGLDKVETLGKKALKAASAIDELLQK
jgi:hypothetical protein